MKRLKLLCFLMLFLPVQAAEVGRTAPIAPFQLPNIGGETFDLSEESSPLMVIAFIGTECPLAKLYAPRLQQIAEDYAGGGVRVLGVASNRQDSIDELQDYAAVHGLTFPVLKDPGQKVADLFGAERTVEVFVLDQFRVVRYHGRVDDQYGVGYSRKEPTTSELRTALDQLLAGQPVSIPETPVVGCIIGRQKSGNPDSDVTFSGDVAAILNRHCVECHREGEIAPFALTEYEEVAGWADTLAEVVRDQRMPPWHANPAHGEFSNARLMTEAEKQTLYDWAAAGAPLGDPDAVPAPPTFLTEWQLPRKPDVVIDMAREPYSVAAEGTIEYQYFAVDPHFTDDTWVAAAEVVPGNRAVVHHAIVFVSPPVERPEQGLGWLSAYVPGFKPPAPVPGLARLVPAGSKLIFQMHYTPNGSPHQDLSKLGLILVDESEVREQSVTLISVEEKFEIPALDADFVVDSTISRFPRNARLLALAPHMHLRGKSFRFTGVFPDGREEILLDVPHYDFNWQHTYQLSQPFAIPNGFHIQCEARYDNSEANPWNPDPHNPVTWGDQSWEEMMVAFVDVAIPREPSRPTTATATTDPALERRATELTEDVLRRFDTNGDGKVLRSEVPTAFDVFAFRQFDTNRDKVLTKEEIFAESLKSLQRRR